MITTRRGSRAEAEASRGMKAEVNKAAPPRRRCRRENEIGMYIMTSPPLEFGGCEKDSEALRAAVRCGHSRACFPGAGFAEDLAEKNLGIGCRLRAARDERGDI